MADYSQTHAVPSEGLPAWANPDGSGPPAANLDPGLDVMMLESRGDWAHIRCSNGWEAWVDGRRLLVSQPSPAGAPGAAAPAPPPQAAPPPTAAPPSTSPPPPTQTVPSPSPAAPPAPSTQPVPQAAPPTQPETPSAAWGAPAAAPGPARSAGGFRLGPGQIIGLAGGVIFFISAWFSWIRFEFTAGGVSASESYSAYRIPAHFLLDSQSELGGLSFGIVVAFFGVVCIATALLSGMSRSLRFLGLVGGALTFLVVVLFLVQTKNLSDALPGLVESGYFSVLRYGAYIGLAGALLSLVGGILALAKKRS
jgi:hypothetical protein